MAAVVAVRSGAIGASFAACSIRHSGRRTRSTSWIPRAARCATCSRVEAPILSPDRRAVAYVTSENDHVGHHTIAVWTVGAPAPVPVLSLWETDPGSGRSFGYRWSQSSAALGIEGATRGFARWGGARHQALRLTYLVASHRLLEPAP